MPGFIRDFTAVFGFHVLCLIHFVGNMVLLKKGEVGLWCRDVVAELTLPSRQ